MNQIILNSNNVQMFLFINCTKFNANFALLQKTNANIVCQKGAGTKLHKLLDGLWVTFAWVNKIATTRSEGDDVTDFWIRQYPYKSKLFCVIDILGIIVIIPTDNSQW